MRAKESASNPNESTVRSRSEENTLTTVPITDIEPGAFIIVHGTESRCVTAKRSHTPQADAHTAEFETYIELDARDAAGKLVTVSGSADCEIELATWQYGRKPVLEDYDDHRLDTHVVVFLDEVDGAWELASANFQPGPLEGIGVDCTHHDGANTPPCPICATDAGREMRERMERVPLPTAEQLLTKLAEALGYEIHRAP
ncbi:hypothetical protein ACTD5D_40390 [Nocardia takedensis]|uniref:hypothetical protein n=1 Tax=Nocardia takedensis TaxID=259390 RepID=UPI003F769D1E